MSSSNDIPESLRRLLEDQGVLKFGVAIQEDVKRLKFHGIHARGEWRALCERKTQICNSPLITSLWTLAKIA